MNNWGDNAIVRYLRETWAELKKVRWSTRREAINLTAIVLAVTIGMALLLGLMDLLFSTELKYVIAGNVVAIGLGAAVLVAGLAALVFALRQEA
ncbi:MAG: preprotein translocase subunit SecE [Thermoflexales bacterium]|nr:preprotein translocase subunit SecE [Thermoflexales bacterium]